MRICSTTFLFSIRIKYVWIHIDIFCAFVLFSSLIRFFPLSIFFLSCSYSMLLPSACTASQHYLCLSFYRVFVCVCVCFACVFCLLRSMLFLFALSLSPSIYLLVAVFSFRTCERTRDVRKCARVCSFIVCYQFIELVLTFPTL